MAVDCDFSVRFPLLYYPLLLLWLVISIIIFSFPGRMLLIYLYGGKVVLTLIVSNIKPWLGGVDIGVMLPWTEAARKCLPALFC